MVKIILHHKRLDEILAQVCEQTGISEADIVSGSRIMEIVTARQVFCHVARKSGFTIRAIAKRINRDHSTVSNSIKAIENHTNADIENIVNKLNNK
jgi:chromosomal replication initiation ATPase DnaA